MASVRGNGPDPRDVDGDALATRSWLGASSSTGLPQVVLNPIGVKYGRLRADWLRAGVVPSGDGSPAR
jgi:hypothetical protein